MAVEWQCVFYFLNQQLTPSTSPLQLGFTLFNFLGFQLLLGLTLLHFLGFQLPLVFNTFNTS